MNQEKINEMVGDYAEAASFDYIGLWQIVIRVRHDFGVSDKSEIRTIVMQIVKGMLSAGLEAVTLESSGPGCIRWENQNVNYVLDRITSEWDTLDREPYPGDIVWFNQKRAPLQNPGQTG